MVRAVIAELFAQCQKVFKVADASILGGAETRKALVGVTKILEKVKASDVGMYDSSYGGQYDCAIAQRVCETSAFAMDIFIVPKSICMPLHDHPEMTVCTKMLYGTAHVVAYDWEGHGTAEQYPRTAKLSLDKIISPDDSVQVLYPENSNIHSIKANTTCAFLDILVPPYRPPRRSCTYYKPEGANDYHMLDFSNLQETLQLVEYEPENFECAGDSYRGPDPYQKN